MSIGLSVETLAFVSRTIKKVITDAIIVVEGKGGTISVWGNKNGTHFYLRKSDDGKFIYLGGNIEFGDLEKIKKDLGIDNVNNF